MIECMIKLTKILRDYKKGCVCEKMKEKLIERQDKATLRAKKLSEYDNPSTKVYKLVEDIEELKKEASL